MDVAFQLLDLFKLVPTFLSSDHLTWLRSHVPDPQGSGIGPATLILNQRSSHHGQWLQLDDTMRWVVVIVIKLLLLSQPVGSEMPQLLGRWLITSKV